MTFRIQALERERRATMTGRLILVTAAISLMAEARKSWWSEAPAVRRGSPLPRSAPEHIVVDLTRGAVRPASNP